MKKHFNILILALLPLMLLALVGCNPNDDNNASDESMPISFACSDAGAVTRAGEQSEGLPLHRFITDFFVYGINGKVAADGSFTKRTNGTVFPNYKVQYAANSAHTTSSNSSDWEYVGIDGQTIKFWDKEQDVHYFWAVGQSDKGDFESPVTAADGRVSSLELTSVISDGKTFYTDPIIVSKINYGNPVPLRFKSVEARIRIGFYEALESGGDDVVSAIYFYKEQDEDDMSTDGWASTLDKDDAAEPFLKGLFTDKVNATITYSYPTTGAPTATLEAEPAEGATTSSFLSLHSFDVSAEHPLSNDSKNPTYANNGEYISVLPYDNTQGLTIKCDYDVLSGGTGSPITVEGKYATIPAAYCHWQSNMAYTYIFKITEGGAIVLTDVRVDNWAEGAQTLPLEWHNW